MLDRGRQLVVRVRAMLAGLLRRRMPGPWTHPVQQRIAIPTYFSSGDSGDADWSTARVDLLALAVINPRSGPGYTTSYVNGSAHQQLQERIDQVHEAGADVVGYVTTNYRDRLSVQHEFHFTVAVASNTAATLEGGVVTETGWPTGFGPIQVRPDAASALPIPLTVGTDYYWVSRTATTGRFATSKANATTGTAIPLTTAGGPAPHVMGLSRTLANISTCSARSTSSISVGP